MINTTKANDYNQIKIILDRLTAYRHFNKEMSRSSFLSDNKRLFLAIFITEDSSRCNCGNMLLFHHMTSLSMRSRGLS
jgi:hypothetical protein